jgi:hypothetical protein
MASYTATAEIGALTTPPGPRASADSLLTGAGCAYRRSCLSFFVSPIIFLQMIT